jgi:uncharacterized LabA/DUF88 family protein
MTERSRRVVLLIDYDNLQICAARDTPGRDLQLTPVVQLAQRYGSVILARAYAEWNLSTERLAVYKAGIEPAFAPVLRTESDRSGKSLADTVMVAEGMDMLWTLSPEVVVLATSDKDLIPLVRVAKQRGAFVVVLGSDFTAIPLREMADEHVTYRQLISEAGVRYATEAGAGRQPAALPEPSRRRRERAGRERGVPPPSPAPTPAPTPAPAPAPTPSAAAVPEPVAPVTSVSPSDADAQTSGRRRRRRGSRRRADRLGLGFETAPATEGETAEEPADEEAAEEAVGVEVAGEVEGEAVELTGEAEPETLVTPSPEEVTPTTPAAEETPEVSETAAPEPAAAPAPRERRRRTRRTTPAPTAADEPEQAGAVAPIPEQAGAVAPTPEPPAQSADIMPAPPPEEASTNGAAPEAAPASPAQPEPTTPARRPRRVASASRGRSRRP